MSGSSTTLTNSDNDLRRDTRATSAVLDGRSRYEFGSGDKEELRSETRERSKWVNRVPELRTGGKLSIGRSFRLFLLFSSLLHTLLLLWISAQYKWRRHGFLPPPDHSQVEVEFPRAPDPPKGYRTVPIGSGTFESVRVRTRHDCLMLSFPFLSLVRYMQPRRSAPREGDTVTAARDPGPGNGHSI